jgi:hypothetical protein
VTAGTKARGGAYVTSTYENGKGDRVPFVRMSHKPVIELSHER